jgi:hypothetical protein
VSEIQSEESESLEGSNENTDSANIGIFDDDALIEFIRKG